MTPGVMIRLDVEAMRYQVVHAFADRHEEMAAEIGRQIETALKDFDFEKVVREEVARVILETTKRAVADACSRIMYESPVRDIIRDGAATKVRQAVEESLK